MAACTRSARCRCCTGQHVAALHISRALYALKGQAMQHRSTHTALLALQVVQGDVFNDPGCVADPAADVWSLGAIAYEMLQGEQLHTNSLLQLGRLCMPCCPQLVTASGPKQLSPTAAAMATVSADKLATWLLLVHCTFCTSCCMVPRAAPNVAIAARSRSSQRLFLLSHVSN